MNKAHHEWITEDDVRHWLDMIRRTFGVHVKVSDPQYDWNAADTAIYESILMMTEDFFNRMEEDE